MKLKKQCILFGLLSCLILAGCQYAEYNVEYNVEKLYNCHAGKYAPDNDLKDSADREGWKIDYIEIINWTDLANKNHCSLDIVLKESVLVMGTDMKVIPIYSDCHVQAMQNVININAKPDRRYMLNPLTTCE